MCGEVLPPCDRADSYISISQANDHVLADINQSYVQQEMRHNREYWLILILMNNRIVHGGGHTCINIQHGIHSLK